MKRITMSNIKEKRILVFRLILWLILAGILVWLVWMKVVPSGKVSYVKDFGKNPPLSPFIKGELNEGTSNYFISKLTPKTRVEIEQNGTQKVIADPVYFSLFTPRAFNKAKVSLKFRIPKLAQNLPLNPHLNPAQRGKKGDSETSLLPNRELKIGVLVDGKNWQYDLKPIYNGLVEELIKTLPLTPPRREGITKSPPPPFTKGEYIIGASTNWHIVQENDLILMQKKATPLLISPQGETLSNTKEKFTSISEFLNNPPSMDKIAVYNYPLDINYTLDGYTSSADKTIINQPLRGAYQFFTYLKNEPLDFEFEFTDLNKNKDSDEIEISIYKNDQIVKKEKLIDDGIVDDSGRAKESKNIKMLMDYLPEGAYKIEIKANDDIITKQIKTKQNKLVFVNKIWIGDGDNQNFNLYTDSAEINAQTTNPSSLQILKVNGKEFKIDETYKMFEYEFSEAEPLKTFRGSASERGLNIIKLEKDGILLAGDGVFSFTESQFFNPKIKTVDENLNIEEVDFILAKYNLPRKEGDWLVSEAEFDLSSAYRENGKYQFIISIPGLRADDNIEDYIEIKEIKVDLAGRSLKEFLSSKL